MNVPGLTPAEQRHLDADLVMAMRYGRAIAIIQGLTRPEWAGMREYWEVRADEFLTEVDR